VRAPFPQRRLRGALVLVLAALASAAGARDGQATPPPQTQPQAAPQKQERPALSPEDAALVQQLALVEHVELLRHLELFEKEPAAPPKKQQ
jgi:glucose/arabinose dehydrogenase